LAVPVSIASSPTTLEYRMGHAERVLQPGERIVYRARLHWIIFAPGALSIIAGALVTVWGGALPDQMAHVGYLAIGAALAATGVFSILRAWFRSMNGELVISTQRIIYKPGWGRRSASEVKLGEAEHLTVSQGGLGRRFNFGTVTVRGGGAVVGPVSNVDSPRDFHLAAGPSRSDRPMQPHPLAR
jgi:hypothetical protein